MRIDKYKEVLVRRLGGLEAALIVAAHDAQYIEASDKRYVEMRLLKRILKLLKDEE